MDGVEREREREEEAQMDDRMFIKPWLMETNRRHNKSKRNEKKSESKTGLSSNVAWSLACYVRIITRATEANDDDDDDVRHEKGKTELMVSHGAIVSDYDGVVVKLDF